MTDASSKPDTKADTKLDAIDRRLIEALQRDGRDYNAEPAARVHLSPPQCFRRVKALEERGVLRGYRALVSPERLGLGVTAFVSLNIDGEAFDRVREIEALIRDFPEILECHTVSGDCDYLLKVVASDLKSLSQFLTDRLMQIRGVADIRSMICLEEIKPPSPLSVAR